MTDEIRNLLYSTSVEDEFGLDEVQLMEIIPTERIFKLIALLDNESKFIAYQAMLILTAWNIEEGFKSVDKFIEEQPDKEYNFEPHRIWGKDNVYDDIAYALYISTLKSNNEKKIIPYFIKLLNLYDKKYFDSKFSYCLLDIEPDNDLLPYIIKALEASLENKMYLQSSQLLPVIVNYDKKNAKKYIPIFKKHIKDDSRISISIEKTINNLNDYSLSWIKQKFNNRELLDFIFFWGHTNKQQETIGKFCFSQWYESPFTVEKVTYKTAEHWMMAQKALLFGDETVFKKIIETNNPSEVKELGRQVSNYDDITWIENRFEIVKQGNIHKFDQNSALKNYLLSTENKIIVEASPVDSIWGIGVSQDDPYVTNFNTWQGENLLGFVLMEVRDFFKENK